MEQSKYLKNVYMLYIGLYLAYMYERITPITVAIIHLHVLDEA